VTIAGGLGLIILGAILRYAVTWHASWIDIDKLGQILMIGGVAGLVVGIAMQIVRRRIQARSRVYEQRYYEEPRQ
jgi:fructose-specific phosphotransferase system IIC component